MCHPGSRLCSSVFKVFCPCALPPTSGRIGCCKQHAQALLLQLVWMKPLGMMALEGRLSKLKRCAPLALLWQHPSCAERRLGAEGHEHPEPGRPSSWVPLLPAQMLGSLFPGPRGVASECVILKAT